MLQIFRKSYFPVAWVVLLHVLLLFPDREFTERKLIVIPHLDKVVHFGLYFILTGSWMIFLNLKGDLIPQKKRNRDFLIIFLAVLDGLLIEYLQQSKWIQRDFDWYDVLFDGIGAVAGVLAASYLFPKFRAQKKPL
jgi:VanZ family protein